MIALKTRIGRMTILEVDGKPLPPIAYMTYAPTEENFADMRRCGVKLFMFPIYAGDEGINMESGLGPFAPHFFLGYGEYDFSFVDRVLDLIAPLDEEVYIIPRVCLEPPKWWQRLHPEECSRDYRGELQRESFSSELWLSDMSTALEALIDHIGHSRHRDRVIGYHIAAGGTEEWAHHARYREQFYDYSEVNLRAYRRFLEKKYGTPEELSLAHGCSYRSFTDVRFPDPVERVYADNGWLRDPAGERRVLDFFDFHNESVADAILYLCRRVKEYTHGERLTGVFYGYVNTMPQNYKGLHALGKLLASPDVDFISTTNQCRARHFASAVASALLHGKVWICEGDVRTSLTRGLDVNLPHAMPDNDYYRSSTWRGPDTVEESVWSMSTLLARVLTTPTGVWWFDMFGGWFADPDMLSVIRRSRELAEHMPKSLLPPTEVAILVDERGHKFSSLDSSDMPRALLSLLDEMDHAGFPYDCYLLSDITEEAFPRDQYKLVFVIASPYPSKPLAEALCRLHSDGRTVVYVGNSCAVPKEVSGFEVAIDRYPEPKRASFAGVSFPDTPLPAPRAITERGYVLSRFEDGSPAVMWAKENGSNSVLALPASLPQKLLSHLALLSGVHLYSRAGDITWAGGEFVGICAAEDGYRRICLPDADLSATDVLTGERVTVNDRFIDLHLRKNETRVLRLTKA